jgi:allantoate deiminase
MDTIKDFQEKFLNNLLKDFNGELDYSGVSGKRVAKRLTELAGIGLNEQGGSNRMGFSPEERRAKELVKTWMQQAGLAVYEDGAGNVIGRLSGKKDGEAAVMSGSHVDTVPNGGHFDGTLGVIAALEVAEAWKETGFKPEKAFEAVIFSEEEGSRFNSGLLGSAAMFGETDRKRQINLTDNHGNSFKEVLEKDGLTVDRFFESKRNPRDIAAFLEVHIEQGKQLERENLPAGIVTGIAGPCWLELTFTGEAGHAGNTPMGDRADALAAAGEFVSELEKLPLGISDSAVATVGRLHVEPNGINVIPGRVQLTVDIRDIYPETRDRLVNEVSKLAEAIADKRGINLYQNENIRIMPVPVSGDLQEKVKEAVESAGIRPYFLPSGAGHDAMIAGRYVPAAMIFVRSREGISHNPKEWSSLDDCVKAVHVLKNLAEKLCSTS